MGVEKNSISVANASIEKQMPKKIAITLQEFCKKYLASNNLLEIFLPREDTKVFNTGRATDEFVGQHEKFTSKVRELSKKEILTKEDLSSLLYRYKRFQDAHPHGTKKKYHVVLEIEENICV
jgi:hypothetical protein